MKQQTLKDSFSLSGKGLHTGAMIDATFCPAPDNHGYKIQRVDLEDQPVIDALADNVVATNRGTVIAKGDVTVSTIEHAMAALYAAGIDNCLIKVNAPELPILDGSAKIYADEIARVGIVEQNEDKDYYIVKHKIEVSDETTGSKIMILPDDEFSIEVKVNFESPVLSNTKSHHLAHLYSCARSSHSSPPDSSRAATSTTLSSSTTPNCPRTASTK